MRVRALLGLMATVFLALGMMQSGNLSGTWQLTNGKLRVTQYVLKATGNTFTGVMVGNTSRQKIVDGAINGDAITFGLTDGYNPSTPPRQYTATLEGDRLTITAVANPNAPAGRGGRGGPPQPQTYYRVSADTVYHVPADIAHAPFPPFQPLPPNGLASTPPMGWNSWNKFAGRVDDKAVRAVADAMVSSGMRDAGYVYVNIDDTWEGQRDAQGVIHSNEKFPDMKALGDYLHSKGLKFGIYSGPGPTTCAGYEASYGHEEQDARTYASWGVDYLKYDWCSASGVYWSDEMPSAYRKMALALRATGRPIVFSLCEYGWLNVGDWGAQAGGNLWRTTGDITDSWQSMSRQGFDLQTGRAKYAAPGHWNDPDMLEIGNGHMSDIEYQTHMSLWSMLAAPLIAGNDIATMSDSIKDILTNRDVIAVDQDKLGQQGTCVQGCTANPAGPEIWVRKLSGGATAVGLFNRGDASTSISVAWNSLGIAQHSHIRNLWTHQDSTAADVYSADVAPHGVVLLRVQ